MAEFGRLDSILEDAGTDGFVLDASSSDSDQRYLSGFDAPDPFVTVYTLDNLWLLVRGLEVARARTTSRATEVRRLTDYGASPQPDGAEYLDAVAAFLAEAGVTAVSAPRRFPLGTAEGLRDRDVAVEVVESDPITELRAVKTPEEVGHIESTQRANEAAMTAAERLIGGAAIDGDRLVVDGDPLTAERVKREIERTLLDYGCGLDETIVAAAAQGADPHEPGSGPIPADVPVVIDVFPRDKTTKYHADMTRTVVRGQPSTTVREWFDLTEQALTVAIETIEAGVSGAAVHAAACEVYESAGYPTLRTDPDAEIGFIHGTGHGIGLDVHELPRLSLDGGELEAGNVVTVEPGLYDPAVGGMRLEDLVVVTESGCEVLTEQPKSLRV